MSEDTTKAAETAAADAENPEADLTQGYAWGDESEDEPAADETWSIPTGGNRVVIGVAVLAVFAAVAAVVAAVVALTPKPQPSHYSIRPPVEVVPPPAPRPPPVTVVTTTVTAAAPPMPQPLTASDRFDLLLEKDGMVSAGDAAENDRESRRICSLVASGANPDTLKGGGADVDPVHGREAIHDALRAYCPALDR